VAGVAMANTKKKARGGQQPNAGTIKDDPR